MAGSDLSPTPGSTCSPRYHASGCWCVVGMALWAGCSLPWKSCGTVWPALTLQWPSCPWAQVGHWLCGLSPSVSVHVWPGVSLDPACFPGNDLGRVLRWGPGYSGEDPLSVLLSVDEADAVLVDRWTILLDAQQDSSAETSVANIEPPKVQLGQWTTFTGGKCWGHPRAHRDTPPPPSDCANEQLLWHWH